MALTGRKAALAALIPLMAATVVIAVFLRDGAQRLAVEETASVRAAVIDAKKAELVNYISLALTSISLIYDQAAPDDVAAQERAKQVLSRLSYDADGYFFAYDISGQTLIHPRQRYGVGADWMSITDPTANRAIVDMLRDARAGGVLPPVLWDLPETGSEADRIVYAVTLDKWNWVIGTAVYIDDVTAGIDGVAAQVTSRVDRLFLGLFAVTFGCVGLVFLTGVMIALGERRRADRQLREMTQRIIDAQEEERGRVARELHDGISQILVSARFAVERVRMLLGRAGIAGEGESQALDTAEERIKLAIGEVRRISRDLRPAMLDDLGLSAALEALIDDFGERTGIRVTLKTTAFKNLMQADAKTAIYRVAQEALVNVERHSSASEVEVSVLGSPTHFVLKVSDNGGGFRHADGHRPGIGLRNMRERIEHFGGILRVVSTPRGVTLEARVPRRLLPRTAEARGGARTATAAPRETEGA